MEGKKSEIYQSNHTFGLPPVALSSSVLQQDSGITIDQFQHASRKEKESEEHWLKEENNESGSKGEDEGATTGDQSSPLTLSPVPSFVGADLREAAENTAALLNAPVG